jgi:hypothetical protein
MTTTFAAPAAAEPKRDRWGRPLIPPADGGKSIPYTRVSTLAKELDSKEGLMLWKQRMVALGIGKRPDLAEMAAVTGPDDKGKLSEIVKAAMAAAESDKAANTGTVLHALTEQFDKGTLESIPEHHYADLDAYEQAMKPLTVIAAEMFVVNDHLQAAGTFDRLVQLPDGRVVVADIKTGKDEPKFPHGVTTQCAIYAHSWRYDIETETRQAYLPDNGVSTDTGLLIHLPAGQGRCDLYLLDLQVGWMLAQTAVAVRKVYKDKPIATYTP